MTTCGTGTGNFPQPGDPDLNNSILSAAPAFGGIDVYWTYPDLLPEAVAHVRLYRSTNADPATRVMLRTVSGEFYYDKVNPSQNVTYYYWIEIVSVNGTIGDLLGPVSAVARPTIDQTIEMLSGQINDSHLAQSLSDEIKRINMVSSDVDQERVDRIAQYDGLLATVNGYQTDVDGVATLLANEVARLDDSDTAQISEINLLGAKTDQNAADIVTEQQARADGDSALASSIETLRASTAQTFYQDTAPDPAVVTLNEGDIWVDTTEPADGSEPPYPLHQWTGAAWLQQDPDTLAGMHAAIEAESLARVNRDGALSQSIETLETTVGQKSRVYFQANPPALPETIGDLWIDTDDNNTLYTWQGEVDGWVLASDLNKTRIIRQPTAPTEAQEGDLWLDEDDGDQPYQWDGAAWQPINLYTGNQVTAAIEDYDATRVGYCLINGSPDSTIDSKDACLAAEGTWLNMQAVADAVKGVQVTDGDNEVATVQQRMVSYKDDIGSLKAEYTAKVQVDTQTGEKIIGGFGIYADGQTATVDAGFDVDRFWVGKLGNKRYPFVVDSGTGETFINQAVIDQVVFDKLRSADGSLMFTPAVYDELGNVTQDGMLKAAYIDAQNLTLDYGNIQNVDIGSADIQNGAITRAKIGNAAVDTAQIANAAIQEAKIANAAVDTLKIKGQAVTFPRGVYSTGVVTVQSVLSVQSMQIGFTGAPVIILFSFSFREQNVQDEVSFVANIEVAGVSYYSTGTVRAWQPGTISSVFLIDLSAGTRTVSITVSASGGDLEINNRSLVILEAKR